MHPITIINQDRDERYLMDCGDCLYTKLVYFDGEPMGVNVMLRSNVLGTFDTLREAVDEMEAIQATQEDVVYVTGHSNGGFAKY